VTWHNQFGKGSEFVRPLVVRDFDSPSLHKWLRAERPDVVIVLDEERALRLESLVAGIEGPAPKLVCSSWTPGQRFSGIDERPRDVATRSVELLASMILHSEKGIPKVATATMVSGKYAAHSVH
jgi:hypothetical protein